jgi:hypothetical protein
MDGALLLVLLPETYEGVEAVIAGSNEVGGCLEGYTYDPGKCIYGDGGCGVRN